MMPAKPQQNTVIIVGTLSLGADSFQCPAPVYFVSPLPSPPPRFEKADKSKVRLRAFSIFFSSQFSPSM